MSIVKAFYDLLPFNKANHKDYIKQINKPGTPWPSLSKAIDNSATVLELGSGQGWLSNRIAKQYPGIKVTGIDLVAENIRRSNEFSPGNSCFLREDILKSERTADTVISVGVLHHIPNNEIRELMISAINKSNKYTFIGLYHKQSREYMFEYFNSIPNDSRYKMFKKMTPWITNETHRRSWYRDQLEHPYECTVTLDDYRAAAIATGTTLAWTNVNTDEELYEDAVRKLSSYEFTSGFVYGMFIKEEAI